MPSPSLTTFGAKMVLLFPSSEMFIVAPDTRLATVGVLVSWVEAVTWKELGFFSLAFFVSIPRTSPTVPLAPEIYTLLPPLDLSLKLIRPDASVETSMSSEAALDSPVERVILLSSSFLRTMSPRALALSCAERLLSIISLLGSKTTLTLLPP